MGLFVWEDDDRLRVSGVDFIAMIGVGVYCEARKNTIVLCMIVRSAFL